MNTYDNDTRTGWELVQFVFIRQVLHHLWSRTINSDSVNTHINIFSFSQRAHELHSLYLGRPSQLKMFPQLCIEKLRTGWMVRSLHAAVGWFIQFQFLFYWCYSNHCITCYFTIVRNHGTKYVFIDEGSEATRYGSKCRQLLTPLEPEHDVLSGLNTLS